MYVLYNTKYCSMGVFLMTTVIKCIILLYSYLRSFLQLTKNHFCNLVEKKSTFYFEVYSEVFDTYKSYNWSH